VPALAVADALRAEGAHVAWVGGERAEARLVPDAGYALHPIAVEGISRSNPLKAARAVARAGGAVAAARRILREERPDVVLGGGGYVAGPVGAAALAARIPIVLTEADSHLGLTNRLLAPRAARVCLAFPIAGRTGPRYLVTGRPVPPPAGDRAAARARFGLQDWETCVLVFGGSLGSRTINEAAFAGLRGGPWSVLHAAGTRDHGALRARLDAAPAVEGSYDLRPYIDGFGEALAACDLCVARAGGSIFEVAAAGRPAILVPYPHAAADHQTANARWMADGGAAVVVADAELTPERLRAEVTALLADPGRLGRMAAASAALARPGAAAAIAAEVRAAAARGA
jgi:UDP-N-acetylglucosamine--N-acetylmuramyl-(pentapeptide) pyrophosphoryl-undecaprenol N-acetylglucosamine transferase